MTLLRKNHYKELDKILLWMQNIIDKDEHTTIYLSSRDIYTYSKYNIDYFAPNANNEITKRIPNAEKKDELTNNLAINENYLKKLLIDGFVDSIDDDYRFRINLSGIIFINNGGYRKQRKLNKLKEENEKIKDFYNKLNIFVIIILTIVSLVMTYNNNDKDKRLYDLENSNKEKDKLIESLQKKIRNKNG